eukprot:2798900-Amphidinium_carterae.1
MQLECGIVQSAYFDDFPTVTYSAVGSATQFVCEGILSELGISYSCKAHKRKAFSETFDLLGV